MEIDDALGTSTLMVWKELRTYLDYAYAIEPSFLFGGKKYGWCYKYRKSSRTLCTLFPEKGSFTVLVTLGKKDLEKLEPDYGRLKKKLRDQIESTHQYHDGKWLWIRMPETCGIQDIKVLLNVKRKPKI